MSWKTKIILALLGLGAAGAGVIFYAVFFTTPHMRVQENIRSFRALMPLAPAQSVPLENISLEPLTGGDPGEVGKGATYYRCYCLYCHGESGNGEGRVGQSYMPKPADLQADRTQAMNDEELLRAMLLGTGHTPVLVRVVPRAAYPHLLAYVRSLRGLPPTERQRLAPKTISDQK